jgi:hypothetical protein
MCSGQPGLHAGAPRRLLASVLGNNGFLGSNPKTISGLLDWAANLKSEYLSDAAQAVYDKYTAAVDRVEAAALTVGLVDDALPVRRSSHRT